MIRRGRLSSIVRIEERLPVQAANLVEKRSDRHRRTLMMRQYQHELSLHTVRQDASIERLDRFSRAAARRDIYKFNNAGSPPWAAMLTLMAFSAA